MARRYVRDNRGRFATTGATARGGRLRTAAGNKRETQTRRISGGGTGGTVAKPRGLAPDRNASVKLATNQRLRARAASRQAAPVAATTAAPAKGSLAANKIEMAKGRSAVLTQQKDSLNKQLKEVNAKIKEAGPSAGAYRLQKLQIQSRLSETRSALAASKAVATSVAKPKTQKERWAARSAMLSQAAAKNEAKAQRLFEGANTAGNTAFNTQPGRLAGRARMNAQTERSFELQAKAAQQRSRAANLERLATTNKGDAAKARAQKAEAIKATHKGLKKGDTIEGTLYGVREVVKVNAKSVTVKGGIKNFTIPWEFIKPKAA